jgi:hypothetical protein
MRGLAAVTAAAATDRRERWKAARGVQTGAGVRHRGPAEATGVT